MFKKILIGIILLLSIHITNADTIVENSGRDYIATYYNYVEKKQYYISADFINNSYSNYQGETYKQYLNFYINDSYWSESIINITNTLYQGSPWNVYNYAWIAYDWFKIIENPSFMILFYNRLNVWYLTTNLESDSRNYPFLWYLVIDKTDNSYQSWFLYPHSSTSYNSNDFYFNKDEIVYFAPHSFEYFYYTFSNWIAKSCNSEIDNSSTWCPKLVDLVLDHNLQTFQLRKYILSNDKKNYIYYNAVSDTLDYYSFDENNLYTYNQNLIQFTGSNTDNLWNFREESLNHFYVNQNATLWDSLEGVVSSLGNNVLIGIDGVNNEILTVPYSNTDGMPSYDINSDNWHYLAWLSYYNDEYQGSYVSNNILYRITNNTAISYTGALVDTTDTIDNWLAGTGTISEGTLSDIFNADRDGDGDISLTEAGMYLYTIGENIINSVWDFLNKLKDFITQFFNFWDITNNNWFSFNFIKSANADFSMSDTFYTMRDNSINSGLIKFSTGIFYLFSFGLFIILIFIIFYKK